MNKMFYNERKSTHVLYTDDYQEDRLFWRNIAEDSSWSRSKWSTWEELALVNDGRSVGEEIHCDNQTLLEIEDFRSLQHFVKNNLIREFIIFSRSQLSHLYIGKCRSNPKLITFATDPRDAFNLKRRRKTTWHKFLTNEVPKYFSDVEKYSFFAKENIEKISNYVGESLIFANKDDFEYQIVSGKDIIYYYNLVDWSCMYKFDSALAIYTENPDKVRLLVCNQKDPDGSKGDEEKLVGRALVWQTDDGSIVMDRVYPSDRGVQTRIMREYADSQGWDYTLQDTWGSATKNDRRYIVTLGIPSTNKWPYIDTFRYIEMIEAGPQNRALSGKIRLSNSAGAINYDFIADRTDGSLYDQDYDNYDDDTNNDWDDQE